MALNIVWICFFAFAFLTALYKWLIMGDMEIFPKIVGSTFDNAKLGFELSLGLTGVMTLWLGLMRVGEKGGAVGILAKVMSPFLHKLFPEIPKNHPAMGAILMNFAANMLGLDNAATPLGLKAMHEMQSLNPQKDTASNAQIMFLVLNTSGLTIVPVSIMAARAQLGAADPSDIFIPILMATFCSTLVGLMVVSITQKINLFNLTIFAYLMAFLLPVVGMVVYLGNVSQEEGSKISALIGNLILMLIIISFIAMATYRRIPVYETFIEGAKEGFDVAKSIIPYLVAMLVAIGVFRTSGAMDFCIDGIRSLFSLLSVNTDFVAALPVALMKPLSGSGARGLMMEAMQNYGVDSFIGRMACVLQGSTDTTFYILAVYFGAVSIKNTRNALACGLIADLAGIVAAIVITYFFW